MLLCSRRVAKTPPLSLVPVLLFTTSTSPPFPVKQQAIYDNFLPWLERKAGKEVSSKLYIGKSAHGRSLFASSSIKAGDCILRVPYDVQLSSEDLPPRVEELLEDKVGSISKLALSLLMEQKIGRDSGWATYISCLPEPGEIHSTIFWSQRELNMIQKSSLYKESSALKAQIEEDFLKIKLALDGTYEVCQSVLLKDFMHAHALVRSRAWGTKNGVSLIPFADFLNHDGLSEAIVLNDEEERVSEVFADRDYAPHEEVRISYGKLPNATLLLDFGFTLPHNIYDQVRFQMNIPHNDCLCEMKLDIFRYHLPTIKDGNHIESARGYFTIKEVKSASGKGKGLPQSLRAFARVLGCTSPQDLSDLVTEAEKYDGRLARRPLEDCEKEIRAHQILLSQVNQLVEEYNASIQLLEPVNPATICNRVAFRRQMALNLLSGEVEVLKSASSWLHNYCGKLLEQTTTRNFECG